MRGARTDRPLTSLDLITATNNIRLCFFTNPFQNYARYMLPPCNPRHLKDCDLRRPLLLHHQLRLPAAFGVGTVHLQHGVAQTWVYGCVASQKRDITQQPGSSTRPAPCIRGNTLTKYWLHDCVPQPAFADGSGESLSATINETMLRSIQGARELFRFTSLVMLRMGLSIWLMPLCHKLKAKAYEGG